MSGDYQRIEIYCPVADKKVCLLLNQKLLPIECSIDVTCRHQRTPLCYLRVEEKEATIKVGDIIFRKDMPEFRFRIVEENKEFPDCWTIEPVNYPWVPWVKTYTASAAWIYECIFKDSTIMMDCRYCPWRYNCLIYLPKRDC